MANRSKKPWQSWFYTRNVIVCMPDGTYLKDPALDKIAYNVYRLPLEIKDDKVVEEVELKLTLFAMGDDGNKKKNMVFIAEYVK